MKKVTLSLCFVFTLLLAGTPAIADSTKILETVERYTQALKAGDVQEIKKLLGGRLYRKKRALLEENTEYSDWLKQTYAGASFSFQSSATSSDQYPGEHVKVDILLANGEAVTTQLVLSPTDDGNWIIVDLVR